MRRLLPTLLLLSLLPGCVFAIGNDGLDGTKSRKRIEQLEQRVSILEQHVLSGGYIEEEFEFEDDDDADDADGPAMR